MENSNPQETYLLGIEEFAALNQVKAATVRARLSRDKAYFGVVPRKLANNRLAFPAVQVVKP